MNKRILSLIAALLMLLNAAPALAASYGVSVQETIREH